MGFYSGLGTIFMLHRLEHWNTNSFTPNKGIAVSPAFLEGFVQDAKQRGYTFVSLDDLSEQIVAGTEGKLLALTFDDGYIDNFTEAYPLLKRLEVPFAIYVTTSFPDGDAVLWWYALEQLLQDHDHIKLAKGLVLPCSTSQEKLDAFVLLRKRIMSLPQDDFGARVNAMFVQTSFDWLQIIKKESLSWNNLCELAKDPLVTIGAHTVSHPVLSALSSEKVRAEMLDSQKRIESRIGLPVTHFCYPFGSRKEAGVREFEIARNIGFKTATTTRWGNIFPKHFAHMNALPRVPLTNEFSWDDFRQQSLRRFWRGRVVTA